MLERFHVPTSHNLRFRLSIQNSTLFDVQTYRSRPAPRSVLERAVDQGLSTVTRAVEKNGSVRPF